VAHQDGARAARGDLCHPQLRHAYRPSAVRVQAWKVLLPFGQFLKAKAPAHWPAALVPSVAP